jgi:uncharacterized protein (TIGR02147 family)
MKSKFTTSRDVLKLDFSNRREANPRFSQRAYAQVLGVSSGRLTEILSGKSPITVGKAQSIMHKLELPESDQKEFLRLVEREIVNRGDGRRKTRISTERRLKEEDFKIISDWEYFTLMSLIEMSTFKSDTKWIAKKMGISVERCEEVIAHLQQHDLITIDSNGDFKNTYRSMSTMTDVPSEVLRKANSDCILHAIEKMNTIDLLARDVTSMTFPVDPKKIKEAKEIIREFKKKMVKLMNGGKTSEIYNLNVQLVPVTDLGV